MSELPQSVDFSHYRKSLKNQDIVADLEKQVNSFSVKKIDVSRQLKAIDAFEQQAVKSAEQTKGKVDAELKDLEKTLQNIESASPFEDLTVVRTEMHSACEGPHMCCWAIVLTGSYRMRLLLPAPISTSVSHSSYPRASGKCPATRYVPFSRSCQCLTDI